MKLKHYLFILSIGTCLFLTSTISLNAQTIERESKSSYMPGELLIRLTPGSEINQVLRESNLTVTSTRQLSKLMNIWQVSFSENLSVYEYVSELSKNGNTIAVQPNHYVKERATTPNDPDFPDQWGLDRINACDAWDTGTGASGTTNNGEEIVIAVLDGGFDLNHHDLNFWTNANEIDNNGIDDDGNGFIDDVVGWNALSGNDNITTQNHGTHVTGIAAATGDNNTDITGVSWNTAVMAVQGSGGNEANVVSAYNYVLSNRTLFNESNGEEGVFVVATNASFGVDFGDPANYPLWCGIYDDLGAAGILNTGATINNNVNVDVQGDVPTGCTSEYLIAVTRTNMADDLQSGGFGVNSIDLGAPGFGILSTLPGDNTGNLSGTSMSTPLVTGAIALLYSIASEAFITDSYENPEQTALAIRDFIYAGADDLASLDGLVGHGRLNLAGAVNALVEFELENCVIELVLVDPINESEVLQVEESIIATNLVSGNIDVTYRAGGNICLENGFVALENVDFLGQIVDCAPGFNDPNGPAENRSNQLISDQLDKPQTEGHNTIIKNNPNPFSQNTTFEIELDEASLVKLEIFDLSGRLITTIVNNEELEAGMHNIVFKGQGLENGVYVYRFSTEQKTITQKMILSK